ncbi:hypothetical protein [Chelativorans xinjiangense]|uniref:hypothetical protein n=1 Tax=Chelativorans xinjiangense TaxID=2681485 RepID=UPI00135AB5BD|nr:hypothetical protein [Chelativorans xinjiangense]
MNTEKSKAVAKTADNRLVVFGVLSGTAGGLAEILWVWAYSANSHADVAEIARGVAEAVGAYGILDTVTVGIAVHMVLAALLGIIVGAGLNALPLRMRSWPGELVVTVGALATVWAFNFLVLLPALSPAFVTAVPYSVSFISKFLFGLSAFLVFKLTEPNPKS